MLPTLGPQSEQPTASRRERTSTTGDVRRHPEMVPPQQAATPCPTPATNAPRRRAIPPAIDGLNPDTHYNTQLQAIRQVEEALTRQREGPAGAQAITGSTRPGSGLTPTT
ncbi:hypothetical protein HPB48_023834 [Haemaphysalis longicornis]|uniref:Uncharacterized protein n=1 Tax=Haemaphysalis longicornis TaxID=44386 RepID=A0A9J6H621_HAELO|nr:hypothetical protein HPB48_023834 [Haemaphysalis longicornis]